jgi:curli production assembly/transport component CsgG
MKKTLISLSIVLLLSGCAVIQSTGLTETDPTITGQRDGVKKEFDNIPAPAAGKQVSVAVYSFADKTGQRRPQANVASLSTAVTQGAETFLIQALQNVGRGQWFEVVERVGIDNLTKERLIIRQMREAYEGNNAKPLMPMQFAGMIIEGGIVGYDTSTTSGGAGMRIFGIGKQTQWSSDTVTISLRAISVNTGKVLMTVVVQKTILSTGDSVTALKFFDNATQSFEAEAGLTINEPGTYAVKAATEMAVVELIKEGQRKGVWDFKPVAPIPVIDMSGYPKPVAKEVKVEEKKDVVVQDQTPKTVAAEPSPAPEPPKVEPSKREDDARNEGKSETVKEEKVVNKIETGVKLNTSLEGIKPNENKMSRDASRALFGQRKLKEDSYLYSEQDYTSIKKWLFKKGTVVDVRQPGSDGWFRVTDSEMRGGWIRTEQVEEVK